MRVQIDRAQLAGLGISEEIAIDLPAGFAGYSPAQRTAWARRQIEAASLDMLGDIAAMHGTVPSPEQAAAYLAAVRPAIEESLEGGGR